MIGDNGEICGKIMLAYFAKLCKLASNTTQKQKQNNYVG
jgi:hypothetical protein